MQDKSCLASKAVCHARPYNIYELNRFYNHATHGKSYGSPTWHINLMYTPLCRVAPSPLPSRPASQTGSYAWSEGGSSSMHEGSSQQSGAAPSNVDFSLHSPGQHLHPAPQLLILYALIQRHGTEIAYLLPCLTASHSCTT